MSLPSAATPTSGRKVDAAEIAEPFSVAVRQYIAQEMGGHGPKLVGLLAHGDPAAKKYAEWTGKACRRDGAYYVEVWFCLVCVRGREGTRTGA